jgi:hypothetical protein
MTEGQFNSILEFFLGAVQSREQFKKVEDKLFSSISQKYGLSRNEFSKMLAEKLKNPNWKHKFTNEQLVELAHRVNSYPVYLGVAKKIPMELVRKEFPTLEKKISLALEQVGVSFTSTANTAPYPVPIGKRMLRRKNPASKR